jgi:hypothetical protein
MARGSFNPGDMDPDPEAFVKRIDDLLDGGDADWAEDTLTGIRETVTRTGQVTPRQEAAIDNIDDAITRKSRAGSRSSGRW